MAERKKAIQLAVTGVIAAALIAAVGIGAWKGRTREQSPSEMLAEKGKQNESTPASAAVAATAEKKELIPVRTQTFKSCSSTPWIVADQKGFMEKEGLKLVFTGELGTNQLLPSILNGNNDVGTAQPNYIAVAKSGGARITAVSRGQVEPAPELDPKLRHMRWYVNPKSGIKTFADLKNYKPKEKLKTNGTENSCNTFLLNTLADKFGVGRDRFEWVVLSTDVQGIQSVSQGILDIVGVHPPYYKSADDAGLLQIADSADTQLGETAGASLYYFTEDFIKKNPETVEKFVRAMAAAQKWSNENPDEAQKLTEAFIGVPVTGVHYYTTSTKTTEESLIPWIQDLEKSGALQKGQIKPSDLITHQFEQN